MRRMFLGLVATGLVVAGLTVPASARHWRSNNLPTLTGLVAQSGGEFDNNRRDHDILLTAVLAANLQGVLDDEDATFTVFGPTDAAFIRTARDLGYVGNDEEGAWNFSWRP